MCLGDRLHGRCCPTISRPNLLSATVLLRSLRVHIKGCSTVNCCNATVKIVDCTTEVTIKQRYENQEKDPIEGIHK
jgi:hypothetical protein